MDGNRKYIKDAAADILRPLSSCQGRTIQLFISETLQRLWSIHGRLGWFYVSNYLKKPMFRYRYEV